MKEIVKLVAILGFLAGLTSLLLINGKVYAVGIDLFDDKDRGVPGSCDVYTFDGMYSACDRRVTLRASQSGDVPAGYAPAKIYFKNVPVTATGAINTASYNPNNFKFSIRGGDFCPLPYGDDSTGVNTVDRLNKGYYQDFPARLASGTKATSFTIYNEITDTTDPITKIGPDVGQYISYSSASSSAYQQTCKPNGPNYKKVYTVKPEYLRRQVGLPTGVFFVEFLAQTSTDVDRTLATGFLCAFDRQSSCAGVENSFSMDEADSVLGSQGIITGGSKQFTKQLARVSGAYIPRFFQGLSWSPGMTKRTYELGQNLTLGSATDPNMSGSFVYRKGRHDTYSFPFAADCGLLRKPGGVEDQNIVLYDIDYVRDATDGADDVHALLLRKDVDTNKVEYLTIGPNGEGYRKDIASFGKDPDPAMNGIWKPWNNSYNYYNRGFKVEWGSNVYQSIYFSADLQHTYNFMLLNVNNRRVSQVGLPYDAAYSPDIATPLVAKTCKATLAPKVGVDLTAGTTATFKATVENMGTLQATSAANTRAHWFVDGTDNIIGVKTVENIANKQFPVAPASITNFGDKAGVAIPNGAKKACTSLTINGGFTDEEAATIYDTSLIGVDSSNTVTACADITGIPVKPFFSVEGGDLLSLAGVTGNNSGANVYDGAYSQIAVFARGSIIGFGAGTGLAGLNTLNSTREPKTQDTDIALKFANQPLADTGRLSSLNISTPVGNSNTSTAPTLTGSVNLTTINSGYYIASGPITLTGTLSANKQVTIESNGYDVAIGANILYTYTKVSEIPRLTVVVNNANVLVGSAVTEVHGIFYASGSSKGVFYTCATGSPLSGVGEGTLQANVVACNKQLKIYGAVSARRIVMSRTYSNGVASGYPPEPAERFIYTPEAWLVPDSSSTFDTYTQLPPIL